ncbi:MAG: PilZ domain-containing protein [Actinomycetota bacterium]
MGTINGLHGTIIEIDRSSVRALLEPAGAPAIQQPVEGALIVVAPDERTAIVASHARPSGSLMELTPHTDDPPDRRADPRVPAHNQVRVQVVGRLGGSVDGRLRNLSLRGCQFVRDRDGGPNLSKRSQVVIDTALDGTAIRISGEVRGVMSIGDRDAYSVRFTEVDSLTWPTIERFVDQRLQRVKATNALTGSIAAQVETDGRRIGVWLNLGDDSIDADLTTSTRLTARFRLPGVPPILAASGMVVERDTGRSWLRWGRTDPITRVLMERAAQSLASPDPALTS